MKRIWKITALGFVMCLLLNITFVAAAEDIVVNETINSDEISQAIEVLRINSELSQERIFTFSPYDNESSSIDVQLDIEKEEILNNGALDIVIVDPSSKVTLIDATYSPTDEIVFSGIEINREYNVFITQTRGNIVFNYRGFLMVVNFDEKLICRSEIIIDEGYDTDTVQEAVTYIETLPEEFSLEEYQWNEVEVPGVKMNDARSVNWEIESNDNMHLADWMYDGEDSYGYIAHPDDEDWYKIYIDSGSDGYSNFWLGNIQEGLDYDLGLYDENGNLLASSCTTNRQEQIYRYWTEARRTYYLKVYGFNGSYDPSRMYQLKTKQYYTATPTFNYKWGGSLSNITYSIMDYQSRYTNQFDNAADSWVYPLNGAGTTNALGGMSRVSRGNIHYNVMYVDDDYMAITYFFPQAALQGTMTSNPSYNWKSCRIDMNTQYINESDFQGVAAHEMGHAFGLAHNNTNAYSIMCQTAYNRMTYWPEIFDVRAFNSRY